MREKGFTLVVIIIGVLITLGMIGGAYYLGKTQSVKSEGPSTLTTSSQNAFTPQVPPPAQKSGTTVESTTKGWRTYLSTGDKIKFDYPQKWQLTIKKNPYLDDYPDAEDFSIIKPSDDGSPRDFVMNFSLTVRGVGGGCPDFNPDEAVVSSKQISVLGKPMYLIYLGEKKTNTIDYAYVSKNPRGFCPNIAFVEIPGLPGLFAADMQYINLKGESIIKQNAEKILTDPNMAKAETILKSLKFNNN